MEAVSIPIDLRRVRAVPVDTICRRCHGERYSDEQSEEVGKRDAAITIICKTQEHEMDQPVYKREDRGLYRQADRAVLSHHGAAMRPLHG